MTISLITFWHNSRGVGGLIPTHTHPHYELVLYKNGSGTGTIGDHSYNFRDGDFVLIPPNMKHNDFHDNKGIVYCFEFQSDTLIPFSHHNVYTFEEHLPISSLQYETEHQLYGRHDIIASQLTELLVRIERSKQKKSGRDLDLEFSNIIAYLSYNYHEKIQLTNIAKQLNMSYDYFRHMFFQQFGVSPRKHLTNIRLTAAFELLSSSNLNCTEIALHCGFSSSSQFSQLFREKYGVTPKHFKKNLLAENTSSLNREE